MIARRLRQFVQQRAGDCCEYCRLPQVLSPVAQLQIEHIIPRKHGGGDDEHNLALACVDCNLAKATNLTGIDPVSNQIVPLFNPRIQKWEEHIRVARNRAPRLNSRRSRHDSRTQHQPR